MGETKTFPRQGLNVESTAFVAATFTGKFEPIPGNLKNSFAMSGHEPGYVPTSPHSARIRAYLLGSNTKSSGLPSYADPRGETPPSLTSRDIALPLEPKASIDGYPSTEHGWFEVLITWNRPPTRPVAAEVLTKETFKSPAWQYFAGVVGRVFPVAVGGDFASGVAELAHAPSAIPPMIASGIANDRRYSDFLNVRRKSAKDPGWFRRFM